MKKILLLLGLLLGSHNLSAGWTAHIYGTGGCGGITSVLVYEAGVIVYNGAVPATVSGLSASRVQIFKNGSISWFDETGRTVDLFVNLCGGGGTSGDPPEGWGDPGGGGGTTFKLCIKLYNNDTIDHTYGVFEWGDDDTKWELAMSFPLSKGFVYVGTYTTVGPEKPRILIGRYEQTVLGSNVLTRIIGYSPTAPQWQLASDTCIYSEIKDAGGLGVSGNPDDLPISAGTPSEIAADKGKTQDTGSKDSPTYDKGTAGGGALTENGFQTGITHLGKKLDGLGGALDRINRTLAEGTGGGTPEEGAVEGTQSLGTMQTDAQGALDGSGGSGAMTSLSTGVGGIGLSSARTLPNTLNDNWPLLIGKEYYDVNPRHHHPGFAQAGAWARSAIIWLLTAWVLWYCWKDMDTSIAALFPVQTYIPGSFVGRAPLISTALSNVIATAIVFLIAAIPILFVGVVSTLSIWSVLGQSPLGMLPSALPGGFSTDYDVGPWIARGLDLMVSFVPFDLALVDFAIFWAWRISLKTYVLFSFSVMKRLNI